MSKQDRQGVRTPADLEMKYNFGKSFAEVMGIANDARDVADKALGAVDNFDNELDSEEIFNRLTENGALQGLYREDGQLYINASYIAGGFLTSLNGATIFNLATGEFLCKDFENGYYTLYSEGRIKFGLLDDQDNAKATLSTLNIDSHKVGGTISFINPATNEPSLDIAGLGNAGYIGGGNLNINGFDVPVYKKDAAYPDCYYYMVDSEKEWVTPPMVAGTEYRTTERYKGNPVYTMLISVGAITASGSKSTTINLLGSIIRYSGRVGSIPLPVLSTSEMYVDVPSTNTLTVGWKIGHAAWLGKEGYCQVWYTKN